MPYLVPSDWTTKNIRVKAEPTAERHPQCDPSKNLTIAIKQSVLTDDVKSNAKGEKPAGFTMAEILLSLTIIGVVAAITLPSLTGNINERTWNTQRKALYARMSQAISLMPALNGYGTLDDTTDTAAETFVTAGLSKVLKINNICDNEHLADCGVVSNFINMAGSKIEIPKTLYELCPWFQGVQYAGQAYSTKETAAVAFETQNGESIIAFYNRSCSTDFRNVSVTNANGYEFGFPQANMCVNFIYDLNGNKGPNTVGKDIGILTVFNSTDPVAVAPLTPSVKNVAYRDTLTMGWNVAVTLCKTADTETRLPNIDELSAMLINTKLINLTEGKFYWSSSVNYKGIPWRVSVSSSHKFANKENNTTGYVRCVRR